MPSLRFKEVETAAELEQIHVLNHRIFAEEVAQHHPHPSGLLIDRFHPQNHYFIAVRDGVVIGMISAHTGPEFSVTKRLPDTAVLDDFDRPVEVRLLAIDSRERNRTVLAGLLWQAYSFAVAACRSHLLISAITERERMYRKLGFRSLGPAVAEGAASFIPMVMPIDEPSEADRPRVRMHQRHWNRTVAIAEPISLLPGPVCIAPRVREMFDMPPVSHRSAAFANAFEEVRGQLKGLLRGTELALFPGGGTLANDAVAANLKAIFGDAEGLILSNGEFGERLARQASMAGLRYRLLSFAWGEPWSFTAVQDAIECKPAWIWAVHLETSTGVLNDVSSLLRLAEAGGSFVALDCVSSIGATPIAHEAPSLLTTSGVSGKSLGSYPGLAFVYLHRELRSLVGSKALCPSFDLLRMQDAHGPVSTIHSSSLFALAQALEDNYESAEAIEGRFQSYCSLGRQMRHALKFAGLKPLAQDTFAAPNITTFTLPSPEFPQRCRAAGFQIAHESEYLRARGWGQIATMGGVTAQTLEPLFEMLRR